MPAILIDTREQRPWNFDGCTVERVGLATGDYSLAGHVEPPEGIIIERKAPRDLAACMTWNRARFVRELERLAAYRVAYIIVEATLLGFATSDRYSNTQPRARVGSLVAWMHRYPGVHWIFAGNREAAARIAVHIFERFIIERRANTEEPGREGVAAAAEVRTP
ncbi:MAG: ERCC4 domain-containing protein [Pirellulales bacterium]|nr:ERCC4 domain-containing protein [Pirellulales bacterium]